MHKSDIEIAMSARLKKINEIAGSLGILEEEIEAYGNYKCKVNLPKKESKGKLILVTAINPTAYGEGKTTVSIGLADGIKLCEKNVALALREPSLGPVFGVKGGATGGGYAQVAPMEDINLHFTGDFHAITTANNLLSALIDNHIHQGNSLNIDTRRIVWRRCMDMNDRALRNIVCGIGGAAHGMPREDGFDITAASEIMAILCLAQDMDDLKVKLGRVIVAYDKSNMPVTASALNAQEAMAILLKDAIKPNLVQTLEGTPTFIHGGPFANIAHGCNSVIATKAALSLTDYVVTEAGFGADLGAEKFLDIKCRTAGIAPAAIVLVATIRALKLNGRADKSTLTQENIECLMAGLCNLKGHIDNLRDIFKIPVVVAINKFYTDTDREIEIVQKYVLEQGVPSALCQSWEKGGQGAIELAQEVINIADKSKSELSFCYELTDSISDKINKIARNVYKAGEVIIADKALKEIRKLEEMGYGNYPVCIAKTQYSFSDNPTLLGRPEGFSFTIREVKIRAGAGFIVALAGDIMLMPGLPVVPNSEKMSIDCEGLIKGLF